MDTLLKTFPSATTSSGPLSKKIDYKRKQDKAVGIRFLHECGWKVDASFNTLATASVLFHRFFREAKNSDYDVYLMACSSLYLAGKLEDQTLKARDIINVSQATLRPGSRPPDADDAYWSLRDSLVQAELLLLRMLRFHTQHVHPHKFMLHYLVSLEHWLGSDVFLRTPLRRTAWTLLKDVYMGDFILDVRPEWVAIACIHIALQCYGVSVAGSEEGERTWYQTLCSSCSADVLWDVVEKVLDVYGQEEEVFSTPAGSISSAVFS